MTSVSRHSAVRSAAVRSVSDSLLDMQRRAKSSTSRPAAACNVTPAQGVLIHEVVLAGGGLGARDEGSKPGSEGPTTAHLATRLKVSSPAVTQLVDTLVAQEILVRKTDPADRRITRIRLTPLGEELYAAFDDARIARTTAQLQALSDDEVRQLSALLAKIATTEES